MKKLSLKFLSVLAFLFVVIAGIQYWHRGILFKSWLDQDFKKAGGLIFAGIQHRQSDLWAAPEQSAKITARLFARLLSQSPDETAQQDAEPPSVPFRLRVGEGENALGIFASAGEEMPAQAQAAVRAGLRGIEERVQRIHGHWALRSKPGEGTTVQVTVGL